MKGQVLLTVDGGVFALFTSYMDHGSVATKIRTRFIAFFYGCGQNIIYLFYFIFLFFKTISVLSSTTYNHFNYERNDC